MELWHFVWLLAAMTGLVSAGLAGSAWAVISGEKPVLQMLDTYSLATPVRGIILAVYAPLAVTRLGLGSMDFNPAAAFIFLVIGIIWSFMQGVFILTTFFGFT